jgi:hypothetical protein
VKLAPGTEAPGYPSEAGKMPAGLQPSGASSG